MKEYRVAYWTIMAPVVHLLRGKPGTTPAVVRWKCATQDALQQLIAVPAAVLIMLLVHFVFGVCAILVIATVALVALPLAAGMAIGKLLRPSPPVLAEPSELLPLADTDRHIA